MEEREAVAMDEKDLIASARKGDQMAFAMLFQQNYPILVKYLIKVTFSPETAEDLAQETMAKAIEKLASYNGKSKFLTWLITIATNLYIDQTRKKKREQNWKLSEQHLRKMKWSFESRNEDWNDCIDALGKLSDEIRIPIILKHYYGYSYEEISTIMKIAEGTVKSRIHNGILTVRKELKLDEKGKNRTTSFTI
ncbi:RNA polymerase sigma factor SigY [Peribacillus acanthi]|uniref:RNA polymerase sigma factor SigY n=1 Tax=Peribacillus acanthi TaxID=2171554 RepID=UPI001F0C1143|nr:RNA polymerase sigma factor SigY [Peribacillus acanthi]